MSGLEIIGFLLGTTGPIEQGIQIIQWLHTHVRNFKENSNTITDLLTLYSQNREQLEQVQLQINKCQHHLSPQALDVFNKIMSQVKDNVQSAFDSLHKRKLIAEKSGVHHFFKATNIAKTCDDVMQLLSKAKESLEQVNHPITGIEANMSITDAQTKILEQRLILLEQKIDQNIVKQNPHTDDLFKAVFQYQHYTQAAKPNFQTDKHSNPISTEAQIKQELLSTQDARRAILAIQGEAGVGKTTTLNMLTTEPDIRSHFKHGIYYISLGADASTDTATQQLREIVRRSGGKRLAAHRENWTNITRAIDETSQWFKDKTFLLLIDDVWDTARMDKVLQDIISQMILTSPTAAAVFTTRNQRIAVTGTTWKVLTLERKEAISRESREILMRHARYPEDSMFDREAEDAINHILKRTAGLAVGHSVAGQAVAQYALGNKGGMCPWIWYSNMNKSIVRSSCANYSSLSDIFSTAIRTLEMTYDKSSSSELISFTKMHRSLCVFEKQEWILISVLMRLWGLDGNVVRGICEQFVKVGLANRRDELSEDGSTVQGIMIHDLLHDFATEEAKRHETVEKWHDRLVTKYSEEAGLSASETCYSWWKLEDVDNGYLMKNLFRHLLATESKNRNMKHVVSRPEWIASQLVSNGIGQYEKDINFAMKQQEEATGGDSELEMDDATLVDILSATKLSFSFILNSRREVWFQLYARLIDSDDSCCVKRYLKDIEESAPRPWLKPVSKCLRMVKSGTKQQYIYVKKQIQCMAAVPGKRDIVCGCHDGSIAVVDTEECKVKRKWKGHDNSVRAICVSPGGGFIVSGCWEGPVKLWDCESCEQIGKHFSICSGKFIASVAVSRDERTVYIGSKDGSIRSWDVDTSTQKTILFQGAPHSIKGLAVLAHEDVIFSFNRVFRRATTIVQFKANKDGRDKGLNRFLPGKRLITLKEEKFALSGDGRTLVTFNHRDDKVNVWNAMNMKKKIATIVLPRLDKIHVVAVNSNGTRIAVRNRDMVLAFEKSKSNAKEMYQSLGRYYFGDLNIHECYIHFIGTGDKLATCSVSKNSVTIQDVDAENQIFEEEPQTWKMSAVRSVTQSPDGECFVTGHCEGEIRLWEARTGKQRGDDSFVAMDWVKHVAFSGDGEWIAACTDDTVAVRSVRSGEMKRTKLKQRTNYLAHLDINCDGSRVVLQYYFGTIELWDTSNDEPLLVIPEDERKRNTYWAWVWFREESDHIVAVSKNETWIEEWDISSGSCVQFRECPKSDRSMSRDNAFFLLDNPESQPDDVQDAPRMFRSGNEIRYGSATSFHILATLESSIDDVFHTVKSNAVCVLTDSEEVRFFYFQT